MQKAYLILLFLCVWVATQDCSVNLVTMTQLIACLNQQTLQNISSVTRPNEAQIAEWKNTVDEMLRGTCVNTVLPNYKTFLFNNYCVMLETGAQRKGWGTFIARMNRITTPKEILIQVPHPITDGYVVDQGLFLFDEVPTIKAILLAGATRFASPIKSTCQPSNYEYDVAHNTDNLFHEATIQFYQTNKRAGKDVLVIQLHGMAESSCGNVSVYLTNSILNRETETLIKLAGNLEKQDPSWIISTPTRGPKCNLNGESNVQGRFLNGEGNETVNWCHTRATSASDRFIHIEQKRHVRDAHKQVIQAFLETFPEEITPTEPKLHKNATSEVSYLVTILIVMFSIVMCIIKS